MNDLVMIVNSKHAKMFAGRLNRSNLQYQYDPEDWYNTRFLIKDGWLSKTAIKMWNDARDLETA
jgi:hypothetical protein